MNRWIHAFFAALAVTTLLALVLLWPRPDPPPPAPGGPPATEVPATGLPAPTGAPSVPEGGPSPCPGVAPARLRVVTFNTHGGVGSAGYDLAGLAEEIRAWDADVVLLQEVHRFRPLSGMDDMPLRLGRLLGMHVVFGRNFTRPPKIPGTPRRESGTAILSTRPILSWANEPLPNFPGLEQRGLLRATIRVDGRPVDLYDTHFQHTGPEIRLVQARAVVRLVGGQDRPYLLGGDFNARPGSPEMQVVTGVAADPWPEVGVGGGRTAPARAPRIRIDYVLHGAGEWVPEQAQVGSSRISDHRPVLLDYALPRRADC